MSGIMQKLFGSNPKPEVATPTPANPGNMPATPGITPNPNNPSAPAGQETQGKDVNANESPMDKYKGLFDTKPNEQTIEAVKFNAKPEDISNAAKQIDYKRLVTPEQLQKINEGGEGALAVMLDVMNITGQKVFADSMTANANIVETALAQQQENFKKALPGIIKQATTNARINEDNPVFNDPAVSPVVQMIQSQLQVKYPNASSKELAEMARAYFKDAAGILNPSSNTNSSNNPQSGKRNPAEMDWSSFLE